MPHPKSTKVFVRFLDSREIQVCPGHFFTDTWAPLSLDNTAHIINASLTKNSLPPAPSEVTYWLIKMLGRYRLLPKSLFAESKSNGHVEQ